MKFNFSLSLKRIILLIGLQLISCSSIELINQGDFHLKKQNNQKNEISLITYNIKAIYDKKDGQIDSVMKYINTEKFDFVLFQELFDESSRDEIIEKSDPFYSTIISRVDYNSFPEFIFQDAGLYMMTGYPRIDLSGIDFGGEINNSNGIVHMILDKELSKTNDFLANKSVMGALFALNDTTQMFLFNTHVQARGTIEHKHYQLQQIYSFINLSVAKVVESGLAADPGNMIVILAGDFNRNAYDPQSFNVMLDILGNPRDLHMEFNGNKEEYTWRFKSGNPRRFDYVFAYDSLSSFNLKRVEAKSINTKDIKDSKNNSVSDHKAIKAKIKFR